MSNAKPLELMLPVASLPAEGAEWTTTSNVPAGSDAVLSQFLRALSPILLRRALEPAAPMTLSMVPVRISVHAGGQPLIHVHDSETLVDLSDVLSTLGNGATSYDDEPAEVAAALRASIANATDIPASNLAVMLATEPAQDAVGLGFIGALVAASDDVRDACRSLDGVLIVPGEEVEGRGVRLTTALLGVLLSVSSPLGASSVRIGEGAQTTASALAAGDTASASSRPRNADDRTTIVVTSQPLQQAPPTMSEKLLAESSSARIRIVVDLSAQRAYLLVNDQIAIETPVSTARPGKDTPLGTFRITEKVEHNKVSTIYNVVLPYWMRLDSSAIGFHVGQLPGKPASAGCVRLPEEVAQLFFKYAKAGTAVQVVEAWTG